MVGIAKRAIMADGKSHMSGHMSWTAARPAAPLLRLVALLTFGLMLGACSKCDVPNPWWHQSGAGNTPAACHSEPAPQ
jgi:hypothetical protein